MSATGWVAERLLSHQYSPLDEPPRGPVGYIGTLPVWQCARCPAQMLGASSRWRVDEDSPWVRKRPPCAYWDDHL
jgi:hypothetical protein